MNGKVITREVVVLDSVPTRGASEPNARVSVGSGHVLDYVVSAALQLYAVACWRHPSLRNVYARDEVSASAANLEPVARGPG